MAFSLSAVFRLAASFALVICFLISGASAARLPDQVVRFDAEKDCVNELEIDNQSVEKYNAITRNSKVEYSPTEPAEGTTKERRAIEVRAQITTAVYEDRLKQGDTRIGSDTRRRTCPPGWIKLNQDGKETQRSHLLAREFGGSGRDIRNVVTGFPRFNGMRGMGRFETRVMKWFEDGAISGDDYVMYKVKAEYVAKEIQEHPTGVIMEARTVIKGVEKERFRVLVLNEETGRLIEELTTDGGEPPPSS